MSICLAQETFRTTMQLGFFVAGLVLAAGVAVAVGVFRRNSVLGPLRLPVEFPLWPIGTSGILGALLWLAIQVIYGAQKAAVLMRAHPGAQIDVQKYFTGADYAFLATVPGIVGLGMLLLLDRALDWRLYDAIAPRAKRLVRGVGMGVIGIVIVLPLMNWAGLGLEALYNAIHFNHPGEHDLLAAMEQDRRLWVRALLIAGACIVAPVFEEYLFRGHLQTFLVKLFTTRTARPAVVIASPASPAAPIPPAPFSDPAIPLPPTLPVHGPAPAPAMAPPTPLSSYRTPAMQIRSPGRVWLAIVITSLVFASFHDLWMAPLILVLALCLGYAYERTGNLWTSITIHALFNTFSTVVFLHTGHG